MRPALTLKDAARFFLPLIFMTELNMISKSVIHAFLARLAAPQIALAAFSIAFTFYYTITSGTDTFVLLSISYLRERRAIAHLLGFFCLVLAPPLALALAMGLTPLGDWLFGGVFGASPRAIAEARLATLLLCLSAPVLMARALAFAMIMLHRRTVLITLSTLLRLVSLGGFLVVLPAWLDGAAVGAAALVGCMVVETSFALAAGRGFFRALPADSGQPLPRYGELWRFFWPLMVNQASEMGVPMTINVFLGRLANPDLALAAFGVVHGLGNVLMSPMRNLVQTAQTLVRTRPDLRVAARFTHGLVAVFAAGVLALFLTPPGGWVLGDVMGLAGELRAYSEPAVLLIFIVAPFWGYAALFRGLLAGARRTTAIALSAALRLAAVVGMGALALLAPGLNGAVFGIGAWALTFAVEAAVLGHRLFLRRVPGETLFPDAPEPAPGAPPAPGTAGPR